MSELDKVIEEKVVEEMERTEVHPDKLSEKVERLTDTIRQEMKNVNTDKELDYIGLYLDEIEEMVNGQKDFYEDSRTVTSNIDKDLERLSKPVDTGKLKEKARRYNNNE